MTRVSVFIDGSNLYFKLRELRLRRLLEFDFRSFVGELVGPDEAVATRYYIGRIRQDGTKKTEELFRQQQRLIARLRQAGITYCFGYLLKAGGSYHEKGVDVEMATDILVAAYENQSDRVILVSSDSDLIPAIKKAREKNREVQYVGFTHHPSKALINACQSKRLISREQARRFLPR